MNETISENTSNLSIKKFKVSDEDINHELVCSIVWKDSSYVNGITGLPVQGQNFEVILGVTFA